MIQKISTMFPIISLLQFGAIDLETPEGRARERDRRIVLTAAAAAIARLVSMAAPLITVPLTLRYLGTERYGLWMTVTSLVGMFTFADLGLGNGLLTAVANAYGESDMGSAARAISSAFYVLGGIALLIGGVLLSVLHFLPWQWLLHTSDIKVVHEAPMILVACASTFLINLPLSVVQRTQNGLQEGFRNNLWQCLASVLGLVAIFAAVHERVSLAMLVLVATGVVPLVLLANGYFLFLKYPSLLPRWRQFDWSIASHLVKSGIGFFLISLFTGISLYSDNIIVAHVASLQSVSVFSVPARVAAILVSVAQMIYLPLWPANGEALVRGDIAWVRKSTKRMLKISVGVIGLAGLGFVFLMQPVLHLWIGSHFNPPTELLVALALWALILSVAGPLFMVLNGANVIWPQVKIYGVFAPVALGLKFLLGTWFGISGVVWGTLIAYCAIVMPRLVFLVNQTLEKHSRRNAAA